jgi:membrane-bound inhibitor of C-type lysozyme
MGLRRLALPLLPIAALAATPAAAAATITVEPATPIAAPAPAEAVPAASSTIAILLGTTGDFERKTVKYGCEGGETDQLAVDFINAAPNYLALVPIDGTVLVFNTVLSGSGARYVAGKYVFSTKGPSASLYDLTQGENAKPILTCAQTEDAP